MTIRTQFARKVVEDPDMGIVMSDGCRLSARVWMPEDAGAHPVPAVLEYIPYRKRDGTLPREQLNQDRRHLHLRPTHDGAYAGEFRLTGSLWAKLESILGPLTKPRTGTITHPDGTTAPRWTRGRSGSAGTMPSRTSATGCCAPTPSPTPAAPRRP
jgi:hypothetical protein